MTKDEALKLALEALDVVKLQYTQNRHINDAITAIKEALAQPEQEPYIAPDLSTLKHSDHCRYWDESEYCTCGAKEFNELKYWKTKALAQPEERNFCQRCGKRTADLTTIHTCTPPLQPTIREW